MGKKTILLVDDERSITDTVRIQLTEVFGREFDYEIAENVEEAWEIIDEITGDGANMVVVISDWLMPGEKGDKFLLDVHQRFPRVVKILLTGQADDEAIQRIKNAGSLFGYLAKPWTRDKLVETIRNAFSIAS